MLVLIGSEISRFIDQTDTTSGTRLNPLVESIGLF